MPAMLDDPSSAPIYRTSGQPPFPEPYGELPPDIVPRQVTLRDRITTATLVPFNSPAQVPHLLTKHLCDLLNREIEKGDTYPMSEPMALSFFAPYWFSNFGAIMVLGDVQNTEEVMRMEERGADWSKECLGGFYIKPNYPGRSSHVCNGGFLVTDAARNRGVGRLMGEGYLEWAPKLGYTYSVFNLVYETNVASLRIWDALGFKRIGRVKGCGNLRSYPDQYIDAIIFGRELGGDGDDYVSEERFDKIRFYLKTGTYPNGSDRAEKSRLRSAATHYRLIPDPSGNEEEKLMLKGKEVISDPHKQYEIARNIHAASHGGINKTTASIAEKFHWVRIKETVSAAIRNCPDCKDTTSGNKPTQSAYTPALSRRGFNSSPGAPASSSSPATTSGPRNARPIVTAGADETPASPLGSETPLSPHAQQQQTTAPTAPMTAAAAAAAAAAAVSTSLPYSPQGPGSRPSPPDYGDLPVDPQIMQGIEHGLTFIPPGRHSALNSGRDTNVLNSGMGVGVGGRDGGGGGRNSARAGAKRAAATIMDEDADVGARLRAELAAQLMHDGGGVSGGGGGPGGGGGLMVGDQLPYGHHPHHPHHLHQQHLQQQHYHQHHDIGDMEGLEEDGERARGGR